MKYLLISAVMGVCFLVNLLPTTSSVSKIDTEFVEIDTAAVAVDTLPMHISAQSIRIRRMEIARTKKDSSINSTLKQAEKEL